MYVSDEDMFFLLWSSIRYAMGRRSYAVSTAIELFERYKAALSPYQVRLVDHDVRAELERVEANGYELGDTVDHEAWKRFAEGLAHVDIR